MAESGLMHRIANAASGRLDRWFESNRSRSSSSMANILSKNSPHGFGGEKNIISASSPEAKAPDCKSGTKKHQRFESFLADYMKVVAI